MSRYRRGVHLVHVSAPAAPPPVVAVESTGDPASPFSASPLPLRLLGIVTPAEYRASIERCNRAAGVVPLQTALRLLRFVEPLGVLIVLGRWLNSPDLEPQWQPVVIVIAVTMVVMAGRSTVATNLALKRKRALAEQLDAENEHYSSDAWMRQQVQGGQAWVAAAAVASKPRISWASNQHLTHQIFIEIGEVPVQPADAPTRHATIAAGQPWQQHAHPSAAMHAHPPAASDRQLSPHGSALPPPSIINVTCTGDPASPFAGSPLPLKLSGLVSAAEYRASVDRCNRAVSPGPLPALMRWLCLAVLMGFPAMFVLPFALGFGPAGWTPLLVYLALGGALMASCWILALHLRSRRQRAFAQQVDRENDKYSADAERQQQEGAWPAHKPRLYWGIDQGELQIAIVDQLRSPAHSAAAPAIAAGQPMPMHPQPPVMPAMPPAYPHYPAVAHGVPVHDWHQQAAFPGPPQYAAAAAVVATYAQPNNSSSAEGAVADQTTAQSDLLRYSYVAARAHSTAEGVPSVAEPPASGPVCPACLQPARTTDRFCSSCGAAVARKPSTPPLPRFHD